jgi:hypothetical protein
VYCDCRRYLMMRVPITRKSAAERRSATRVDGASSVSAISRTAQQNDAQLGEVCKTHERVAARLLYGHVEGGRMGDVFSPASSRRLGRSLRIDTIPLKTGNWDYV